jgi:ribosomal protein S14
MRTDTVPVQRFKLPKRIRSKCINCGEHRSCIKIEARAPIKGRTETELLEQTDYELSGPMVEICRNCLRMDFGTLAHYLLEAL